MKSVVSKNTTEQEGSLYDQVLNTKPEFASNAEAFKFFSRELSQIADSKKVSVEQLVLLADESDLFSKLEQQKILRLSRLVSALRA